MQEITVTPLEALYRLIGAASMIDSAECKDEAIYNTLQGELAVAKEVAKALAMAPKQEAPGRLPYAWVNAGTERQQTEYATLSVGPDNPWMDSANAFPVYAAPAYANGAMPEPAMINGRFYYTAEQMLAAAGPDAALASLIHKAQSILAKHLPPDGPDAKTTISALLGLLDGPESRAALSGDKGN